jgi:hypothetical protein
MVKPEKIDEGKVIAGAFGLVRKAEGLIKQANRELGKIGLLVTSSYKLVWIYGADIEDDEKLLKNLQNYLVRMKRLDKSCAKGSEPEEPARKDGEAHSSKRS